MVAYGVYRNNARADNNHQVILQYDVSGGESTNVHSPRPIRTPPARPIRTAPVTPHYGVQNVAYDDNSNLSYMGVYRGSKPGYPNRTMYVVDGTAAPQERTIEGQLNEETGLVVPLVQQGLQHEPTGIYGWEFKSDVGIEPVRRRLLLRRP